MTRQGFIDRLRLGLSGLPPQAIQEIVADYEAHFTEGHGLRSQGERSRFVRHDGRWVYLGPDGRAAP